MAIANQTAAPLTVEQVIQEVRAELGQPTNLPVTRKISRLRQMQYDLRTIPTTGNFQVIKRIIYKLNFFIVVRLPSISDGIISLIDELYGDVNRRITLQEEEMAKMKRELEEVNLKEAGVIRIGHKELQPYTYQGVTLWIRTLEPWDQEIAREVHEHYCPDLIDYKHLQYVIDIGGHMGSFTAYVKHQSPQATVHTVELDLENFTLLRLNVGNLPGVHIHNAACSYGSAEGMMLVRDLNNTGNRSLVSSERAALAMPEWKQQTRIETYRFTGETVTLEALMPPDQLDLLKIDCEGCEHDVLMHCEDATLARIRAIVGEYHGAPEIFRSHIMARLGQWFELAHWIQGPDLSLFCLLKKQ